MIEIHSLTKAAYELHLLAGAAIALATGRKWLFWLLLLAVSKEVLDFFHHGKPDVLDIIFTLLGALIYRKWKEITSS